VGGHDNSFFRDVAGGAATHALGEKLEVSPPPGIFGVIGSKKFPAKSGCQKNSEVKIAETKDLARRFALEQTVTASTMIADLNMGAKVARHMDVVERRSL